MNVVPTRSSRSLDARVDEGSARDQEKPPRGLFVPPYPAPDALLAEREQYRHALLNRRCLLVALLLAAAAYPIAFAGGGVNLGLVIALTLTNVLLLVALWLNSWLWCRTAGLLAVSVMNLALMSQALTSPTHRFDAYTILVFCLFIQPELVALSMLGWRSVFVVTAINILFMLGCASLLPHSPEMAALLSSSWYHIALLVATVHLYLAFTLAEWVKSNEHAIRRADRATEMARLEQDLTHASWQRAQQQEQLEQGVKVISQVHAMLANGQLQVRVPLLAQPDLQALGGKLNILITRYERALADVQQLVQVQHALGLLLAHLHERQESAFPLPMTHTILDSFIRVLNRTIEKRTDQVPSEHFSQAGKRQPL